jgi:5-formyltetrahydrofolate cyclo-ligase
MKNKTELRQIQKVAALSDTDIEEKSLACNKILTLPIWENTYFHIFCLLQNKVKYNLFCTYYRKRQRNYRFKGRF